MDNERWPGVYVMPIEEHHGEWSFRVFLNGRMLKFGPYGALEQAAEVRKFVVANPEKANELGGRLTRL